MQPQNIAVFFGGRSAEHEVSIITAYQPIIQTLLKNPKYKVWPIYINPEGNWYYHPKFLDFKFFQKLSYLEEVSKMKPLKFSLNQGLTLSLPGILPRQIKINLAFPALHGTYGEDGSLMGLLRLANIPFVGCDLRSSALAMDKILTKQVLAANQVPVVNYYWFNQAQWTKNKTKHLKKASDLTWPLFVKPAHLGSSIAISKVSSELELESAIELAFHYDNKVLIEESISNLLEITVPLLGNHEIVLAQLERNINQESFFNFNQKYLQNTTDKKATLKREIPAKIDPKLATEIKKMAKEAYYLLNCSGLARIDFLINQATNQIFVNEINTLPGSLYAHNWLLAGYPAKKLIETLINLAIEHHQQQQQISYNFQSPILRQLKDITKN